MKNNAQPSYSFLDDSEALGGESVDSYPGKFLFADGSRLSMTQLITAQGGYAVEGTAAGDSLVDTSLLASSFTGGAGNDSMPLAA